MVKNNKTLEDLELNHDKLSKNTLITLQFVINHYNETNECFHVTHDKDHYHDCGCRLCGITDVGDDRFCSWNYHMDCDDDNCFESLSSLLLNKIMKKKYLITEDEECVACNNTGYTYCSDDVYGPCDCKIGETKSEFFEW